MRTQTAEKDSGLTEAKVQSSRLRCEATKGDFMCVAPSCGYIAESGSQFCAAHNGTLLTWYTVNANNGKQYNIRSTSQQKADKAVAELLKFEVSAASNLNTQAANTVNPSPKQS